MDITILRFALMKQQSGNDGPQNEREKKIDECLKALNEPVIEVVDNKDTTWLDSLVRP